jgi:hypothetical protein
MRLKGDRSAMDIKGITRSCGRKLVPDAVGRQAKGQQNEVGQHDDENTCACTMPGAYVTP